MSRYWCCLIAFAAIYAAAVSAWCLPRRHPLQLQLNRLRYISARPALRTNRDSKLAPSSFERYASSSMDSVPERDSARFRLDEQSLAEWATFAVAVSAVLGVEYYAWLYSMGPQLGSRLIETISAACSGNSVVTFSFLFTIFGVFHSGLAALRPAAEEVIGARAWRYVFALVSLPLAFSSVAYFLNHRYDGGQLWSLQGTPGIHTAVWLTSVLSFLFLCPSTFNLLEVAAVRKPELHIWETGAARISRHPQMVGQLLWCAAHTAYIGSGFMCSASALLCAYHVFGAWHGDQRLRQRFGAEADDYFACTSVVPFAAVLQGRQRLPADYYREFLRVPYLAVLVGSALAYELHPLMLQQAAALGW